MPDRLTQPQVMRLIWIDMFVSNLDDVYVPVLRREHLGLAWGISTPQASIDLSRFQALWPGRLTYDRSRKGYRAADGSQPAFAMHERSAVALACRYSAAAARRLAPDA